MPPAFTLIQTEDVGKAIGEGILGQWLDLDCLLIHLWESRSIRSSLMRSWYKPKRGLVDCIGSLLPEITKRGMVERGW